MEITETKRFIPKRFELGTTLSLPIWSMFHDETISHENVFETIMSRSFKGLYLVLYAKQNTMNELQPRKRKADKTVEGVYIILSSIPKGTAFVHQGFQIVAFGN